jgi:hypothetical protein
MNKIKLLLLFLIVSTVGNAQNQINSFYGTNGFVSTAVTNATAPNQSSSGAIQNWTFSGFVTLGTTIFTNETPTASETTTYPGSTSVIVTNSTQGTISTTGKMFTKNTSGTVSITGLDSGSLNINFNGGTNGSGNATLGLFPMTYPFTYTDNTVSGNYVNGTNTGIFSGTLTTTVDGYGILNLPDYGYSGNVTRLKTVLSVTLYLSIFPIGTATQTTYAYYENNDPTSNFKFRSINTVVSATGINQNDTTYDIGTMPIMENVHHMLESVWIQNPIEKTITINSSSAAEKLTINLTDMLGKTIYQTKNETINGTLEIPISINKGMYFITIGNENGTITKKLIKN